ncbi:MAG: hypothetical protein A2297_04930 [Elusimicrobia bacterium RIFOXYB2_FULL_48_7]|nr:MAG: hypothetical protein A2297_04930 [Elusimicrobia bacterium RIFOXYB2_FULL_48_7]
MIPVLILLVFASISACICGDTCVSGHENDSTHCFTCCTAGDHNCAVGKVSNTPAFKVSYAVFVQDIIIQRVYVPGVDHPPKVSS